MGGDVTKNRDFIEGKMVAHGQFFIFLYAFIQFYKFLN